MALKAFLLLVLLACPAAVWAQPLRRLTRSSAPEGGDDAPSPPAPRPSGRSPRLPRRGKSTWSVSFPAWVLTPATFVGPTAPTEGTVGEGLPSSSAPLSSSGAAPAEGTSAGGTPASSAPFSSTPPTPPTPSSAPTSTFSLAPSLPGALVPSSGSGTSSLPLPVRPDHPVFSGAWVLWSNLPPPAGWVFNPLLPSPARSGAWYEAALQLGGNVIVPGVYFALFFSVVPLLVPIFLFCRFCCSGGYFSCSGLCLFCPDAWYHCPGGW